MANSGNDVNLKDYFGSSETSEDIKFVDSFELSLADLFKVGEDNKVDERITIADANNGRVILTPKEAIKLEKWCIKNRKTYLNGTPCYFSDGVDYTLNHETYSNRLDSMVKVLTFPDIDDPLELKIKAADHLLRNLRYPAEISASSVDLRWIDLRWETFQLAQLVQVEFPGWKSDYNWEKSKLSKNGKGLLRIEKMEIDIDKCMKKITLGTPKHKELTEITREIKEEAEKKAKRGKVISEKNYENLHEHDPDELYYVFGDINTEQASDDDTPTFTGD